MAVAMGGMGGETETRNNGKVIKVKGGNGMRDERSDIGLGEEEKLEADKETGQM